MPGHEVHINSVHEILIFWDLLGTNSIDIILLGAVL